MLQSLLFSSFIVFTAVDLDSISVLGGYADTYYGDPITWKNDYPECDGDRQSPIRISRPDVVFEESLGNISFIGYDEAFQDATYSLINTGTTAMAGIDGRNAYISGGGLLSRYVLWNMHFHWGSNDTQGCEHVLEGIPCSGELHLVHVKETHQQFDAGAVADPTSIAVIGVILQSEESATNNTAYQNIVNQFSQIRQPDSYSVLEPFALRNLLPEQHTEFFRYNGSLTTKPCYENVVWTVLRNPVVLSTNQMDAFRLLFIDAESTRTLSDNIRPPMPLGDRKLLSNFAVSNEVTTHLPHDAMTTERVTNPSAQEVTGVAGNDVTTGENIPCSTAPPVAEGDDQKGEGNGDDKNPCKLNPCDTAHNVQVDGNGGGFSIFQYFNFFLGGSKSVP